MEQQDGQEAEEEQKVEEGNMKNGKKKQEREIKRESYTFLAETSS